MKDHREIGQQLDLFMFSELSPGCPIWLPRGNTVYSLLSDKIRQLNQRHGYVEVRTPLVWNRQLFQTSGHWDHFKQNMFLFGTDDPEVIAREPWAALKPMNCPGHMVIFKSKRWSYRDLPYRIHDQGILHRNESSGSIGGLTRTRCFCQDDAHIFTGPESLPAEIDSLIFMVMLVYAAFNMEVSATLSTRPDKFMGDPKDWDHAEKALEDALKARSMNYQIAKGDGAFYGPKIDFVVKDSQGRGWQTATVQLDFQLPKRFELSYQDANDQPQTPIVIHRAIYGSFERFIGILLEHTQGDLPFWLAPVQTIILPISQKHEEYAKKIVEKLSNEGVRAEVDLNNSPLPGKVKSANERKIPVIAVVGDREVQGHCVSVRCGTDKDGIADASIFIDELVNKTKFSF